MDIVLLVLSLALAGTCAGIWLWLQAHAVALRLRRENDRLETRIVQQTQILRRALTTAKAQVERLTAEDRPARRPRRTAAAIAADEGDAPTALPGFLTRAPASAAPASAPEAEGEAAPRRRAPRRKPEAAAASED